MWYFPCCSLYYVLTRYKYVEQSLKQARVKTLNQLLLRKAIVTNRYFVDGKANATYFLRYLVTNWNICKGKVTKEFFQFSKGNELLKTFYSTLNRILGLSKYLPLQGLLISCPTPINLKLGYCKFMLSQKWKLFSISNYLILCAPRVFFFYKNFNFYSNLTCRNLSYFYLRRLFWPTFLFFWFQALKKSEKNLPASRAHSHRALRSQVWARLGRAIWSSRCALRSCALRIRLSLFLII